MAWIRTIHPDDADGPLREEYDRALERTGRVSKVLQVSSLAPEVLRTWVDVYVSVMAGPLPLSRAEREMVAVVVSQANRCHY